MNNKLIIQFLLLIIFTISIILFYLNFFKIKQTANISNNKSKTEYVNEYKKNDLIEGVEYVSRDKKNNFYQLNARSAINSSDKENVVILKHVKAKLIFDDDKRIDIFSDFAEYNLNTEDTFFYNGVKLIYEDHRIKCDNIDVEFTKNIARLRGNLVYKNLTTKMFADLMIIDLVERTSRISMLKENNKIKAYNKNGIN